MASTASTSTLPLSSSSSAIIDGKGPHHQPPAASLPTIPLPPTALQSAQTRSASKTASYCRKNARNVVAMATGEAPAEVAAPELPEIVKTIQEAWDKLEDKYAISSLAAAVALALWGSTGMITAIDRIPLIPGALELVGIGYTGVSRGAWFTYRNLVFKPDREALIKKIKDAFNEIIGSS
ncbi:Cyanobacterial aminoacyl-tRNA synthetase, CAAD domain [Dillenia turbinata]|uniref:Cyanobacterial aminoacyl-tRNA synthetase, CAAD domain n=1 Tax=Dillenia turbinata TaxID=194707 RepID=A0AAN8UTN9_9MAGN